MALQLAQTPQGSTVGPPLPSGPMQLRAGDDARRRGLADPAHAGQHEGMGEPAGGDGVGQGADHRFLADQAGEVGRPVFARENLIGRLLGGGVTPAGSGGCGVVPGCVHIVHGPSVAGGAGWPGFGRRRRPLGPRTWGN